MTKMPLFVVAVLLSAIIGLGVLSMEASAEERQPIVDTDNDGMDDEWENQYNLIVGENDAQGDLDEDGMTNIEEFHAYTDPENNEDSQRVQDNRILVFIGVAIAMGVAAIMSSIGIGLAGTG